MNSNNFYKGEWRLAARVTVVIFILIGMGGCAGTHHPAPVDSSTPIKADLVDTHRVSQGETLYGIAWRYNVDFKALAAVNGFSPDRPLYVGQALSLDLTSAPKTVRVKRISQPAVSKSSVKPPVKAKSNSVPIGKNKFSNSWQWPLQMSGKTRRIQNSQLNKALDIAGEIGESVIASAPGRIVYAGDGLRGYGNLIIVKHSDHWLSAYGNNRKILVKEGQTVKAKQIIAELGVDDTQQARLHFEVRKDGAPVNPRSLLPKN